MVLLRHTLLPVTELSPFYVISIKLIIGRYYACIIFCTAGVEIIYKVRESHSLRAIPQLSI